MYLIYDTETTGFPSKTLPASHPAQARVIQLAALLLDKDFNQVKTLYTLIKLPLGKLVDDGAYDAHGISEVKCNREGRVAVEVITDYIEMLLNANYVIAHNLKFDKQMLNIEAEIVGCIDMLSTHKQICTMELMTPICKLPHKKRNSFGTSYKWPKLSEAYFHCFGKDFEGAHDALSDVRATAEVFKWLVANKYIKLEAGMVPA